LNFQFAQHITDVLLRHVVAPQASHFNLGFVPMPLDKCSKGIPISDFMSVARLKPGDRLILSRFCFPFQPQIQVVAANLQHAATAALPLSRLTTQWLWYADRNCKEQA
jgi:hypothetical protein